MSVVGEAKGVVDLLTSAWTWVRDRRDPVRGQAQRLIDAFEAHGVHRQQIARVLPPELSLAPGAFSTADKLKERLTHPLLDWAAEYLAISRPWLDGTEDHPQRHIDGYKNEVVYAEWFQKRLSEKPDRYRRLFVWAASDPAKTLKAGSYLTLAYAEDEAWLDNKDLTRYWLLSNEWRVGHAPCLASMRRTVTIANSLRIQVIGREVPESALRRLERGRLFAADANKHTGKLWYPEDVTVRWPT